MEDKLIPKAPEASAPATRSYGGFLKNNIREYGMLLSRENKYAIYLGFFQYMTDGTLLEAAEPDQPDPAEQLRRRPGARHAAG